MSHGVGVGRGEFSGMHIHIQADMCMFDSLAEFLEYLQLSFH